MDAHGEIGRVEQRSPAALDESGDSRQLVQPPRRTGHRRHTRFDQPLQIGHHRIRARELHRHVGPRQPLGRERAPALVLGATNDRQDRVPASLGEPGHRLAHLASTHDRDAHAFLTFTTEAQRHGGARRQQQNVFSVHLRASVPLW